MSHSLSSFHRVAGCLAVAAWGVLSMPSAGAADSWKQWRGPQRTALLDASARLPEKLSGDQGIELIWERDFGPSYSGPVISQGIVVTTETVGEKYERVTAMSVETGEVLWTDQWEGAMSVPFFAAKNGSWIRATPAIANGRVYVAGMCDMLVCLDLRSGERLWKVDLTERFGTALPQFGFASSPLVDDGAVYVQGGGGLCKLDAVTGETIWRSLGGEGGKDAFSSPVIAEICGVRQLVVQTRPELCGVDPETGEVLWNQPIEAFREMNILTPTVLGDRIFTSAHSGRSELWDLSRTASGGWEIDRLWEAKHQAYMASPVLLGDYLYMHLRNTRFTCIDMKTGEAAWITRPVGDYWSMVASDDRILSLSSDGVLRLIEPTPEEYREVDQLGVADDSWAHLAVAGNLVFVRDLEKLKVYRFQE